MCVLPPTPQLNWEIGGDVYEYITNYNNSIHINNSKHNLIKYITISNI